MPSEKRTRQRLNKLAGEPVSIVVCAYPSRTIEPALGLLKSSVLYGDEVLLHSPIASMLASVTAAADGSPDALIDLILAVGNASLDPSLSETITAAVQPDTLADNVELLRHLANPNSMLRQVMGAQFEAAGLALTDFDTRLAEIQTQIASVAASQSAAAGLDQIQSAVDAGIVRLEPVDLSGDDLSSYFRQLEALLDDKARRYPLFDDRLGNLISKMVDLSGKSRNPRAISRGAQAVMSDRLLAQLPTFPMATMDEIVTIRDELRGPLIRFRAEMVRVTAEMNLDAVAPDFEDAAIELWRERVAPAIDELNEIVAESGLIRTYGKEAALKLGIPAANGMAVGIGTGNWTVATLWSMANLAAAAGGAASETRKAARIAKRSNPYYFLHTVDRRLS